MLHAGIGCKQTESAILIQTIAGTNLRDPISARRDGGLKEVKTHYHGRNRSTLLCCSRQAAKLHTDESRLYRFNRKRCTEVQDCPAVEGFDSRYNIAGSHGDEVPGAPSVPREALVRAFRAHACCDHCRSCEGSNSLMGNPNLLGGIAGSHEPLPWRLPHPKNKTMHSRNQIRPGAERVGSVGHPLPVRLF